MNIGIIGAGLAGATAARHLSDAGHAVCVLEKSGGTGGRLSTRRSDVGLFDHGAQYLSAKGEAFEAFLSEMEKAGAAARWSPQGQDRPQPWYRGMPGMSGLVKPLLAGIDVRNRQTANAVQLGENGVSVSTQEGETFAFDRLLVCCPTPQAKALVGALDHCFDALDTVVYAPCWTAMLAFERTVQSAPDVLRGDHEKPLGWLTRESAKRGADGYDCFTMQAGMAWSAEHLERDKDDIAAEMAGFFCDYFKTDIACVSAAAHRWRYAAVTQSVGTPFLSGCNHHIIVAGDGLLGGRAEAAFDSGLAAAEFLCAQAT
ncbi:MAG: FAD-dependent oxidoreductase [Ahrensia sp.]